MSNKFPLPLVSMTAMGVYVITGCLAPADALSCFSNSSVIIMGSMFIVAGGLNRTQMVHKVTDLAYKISGGSFQKGMILYCLVTLAIAQVAPSAILIFSICYPLVADFCRKNNQSPSKAMFSIVLISICTVTSLPIGSGATSYITANSLWETYGITFKEGMFDPMLVYLPTIILSVLFAMFYCPKVAPDYGSLYTDVQLKQMKEQKPLDPFREFMGYGIFVAVVIAILFSEKLPATNPDLDDLLYWRGINDPHRRIIRKRSYAGADHAADLFVHWLPGSWKRPGSFWCRNISGRSDSVDPG